jgi:hypothetical protein
VRERERKSLLLPFFFHILLLLSDGGLGAGGRDFFRDNIE